MFRIATGNTYAKFLPHSRPAPFMHHHCIRFLFRHLKVGSTFRLTPKPNRMMWLMHELVLVRISAYVLL